MNPKDYLSQVRTANTLIDCKQIELDELRRSLVKISVSLSPDKVQSTSVKDKIGDTVAKIIDLENELNAEINKYVDLKKEVMKFVDQLPATYAKLLYSRYFLSKSWEQIACDMNYSYRQVLRLHGKALLKLKDVIQCHIDV